MDGNHYQPPPCSKGDGGQGEGTAGTWVMGNPVPPYAHPANQHAATWVAVDKVQPPADGYPSYPGANGYYSTGAAAGGSSSFSSTPSSIPGNPYVQATPVSGSSDKGPADMIFKVLGRCGKTLEDNTRKAGSMAGNVWQHLNTSHNLTDATLARLAQGTKVFAEGGHDKIFQQSFGTFPGEKLLKSFACYISTSSGPVIGTLYLSTTRLAFCSNNPLCAGSSPGNQDWRYYKVVVQLDMLRAVVPSSSRTNPAEKYIQIVTLDNHEFWFMGFMSYDKAVKNLTEALQRHGAPHPYQG